eukprot:gene5852-14345_t
MSRFPWPICNSWNRCGRLWNSEAAALEHIQDHVDMEREKSRCRWTGCQNKTEMSPKVLKEHLTKMHVPPEISKAGTQCGIRECGEVFTATFDLEVHRQMAHGIFAPVPKRIKTSDKDVKKEVFDDEDELGAIDASMPGLVKLETVTYAQKAGSGTGAAAGKERIRGQ